LQSMLGLVAVVRKTLTHVAVNTPCGKKYKQQLSNVNKLVVNAVVTVF
jgi:hypothetical protein